MERHPFPLPEFRLSDEFEFSSIGVDFAGPLYVKDVSSKSGHMNKAYIVGAFFWDYSGYSYSGLGITEYTEYQFRKEQPF